MSKLKKTSVKDDSGDESPPVVKKVARRKKKVESEDEEEFNSDQDADEVKSETELFDLGEPEKKVSTKKVNKVYAEFFKGYNLKVLIDVFSGYISRGMITFSREGIYIREWNESLAIVFDLVLPKKYFQEYVCTFKNPYNILVNYKYWQKLVKTVKKKDFLALSIQAYEGDTDNVIPKLLTSIWTQKNDRFSSRRETNHITFQAEQTKKKINLPENYELGKTIPSCEFQKIKKMTNVSKKLIIEIQRDKYLSFSCDGGDVMGSEISFGEKVHSFEKGDDESSDDEGEQSENEDTEDTSEYPGLYSAEFDTSLFGPLVKLAGLAEQMSFYSPKDQGNPLKIELQYGNSAILTIFIKDSHQIEYERLSSQKHDSVINIKSEGKGRGRGRKCKKL